MNKCFFVSDLHGFESRYLKLFDAILAEKPTVVFFGGDLMPHTMKSLLEKSQYPQEKFVSEFLTSHLLEIKEKLGNEYPEIFIILGNDDARIDEKHFLKLQEAGFCHYINESQTSLLNYQIFGYGFVPPTPFSLKDFEKFDVGQYVDPGCSSPLAGHRTIEVEEADIKYSTIQKDLVNLVGDQNLENAIFLMHSPPYQTKLDRADLDGKTVDHVPLDVHCGSIAIKRFIENHQPLLTLHGHIHESTRLTGSWHDKIGQTHCFSAAHDGNELCIVKFDIENLSDAKRELI